VQIKAKRPKFFKEKMKKMDRQFIALLEGNKYAENTKNKDKDVN